MLVFLKQTFTIARINLLSVPRRLAISIAAVSAIMFVVLIVLGSLALDKGLGEIAQRNGSENVAVLLRSGANSEINSQLSREQVQVVETAPFMDGVVVSPEVVIAINAQAKQSGDDASLTFRGVDFPAATALRPDLTVTEGRLPRPGSNEVLAGRRVSDVYSGFDVGSERRISDGSFRIVGVFDAGGGISESEIWGDVSTLQSLFDKGSAVQAIRVALPNSSTFSDLAAYNQSDERLGLDLQSESDFLKSQSQGVTDLITLIGQPLAIVMALGAFIGAANAMSVSVSDRSSEIATLRTLGFSRSATFAGTVIEAMVLVLVGAMLGVIAALAVFQGMEASTISGGFFKVFFDLSLNANLVVQALLLALAIGLLGSMLPAWRAAHQPLLENR